MLVPRLHQNVPNVNTECAGKPKHLYSLFDQSRRTLIYFYFFVLTLIYFFLLCLVVTMLYMIAPLREQLQKCQYRSNTGGATLLQLLLVIRWQMTIWIAKLKTKQCIPVYYSCKPESFNILAIGQSIWAFIHPVS